MTDTRTQGIRYRVCKIIAILFGDICAFVLSLFFGGFLGYFVNVYLIGGEYEIFITRKDIFERSFTFVFICLFAIAWFASKGRYTELLNRWENFGLSTRAVFVGLAVEAVIQYVTKQSFSRLWMVGSWTAAMVMLPLFYMIIKALLSKAGIWATPMVLVGSSDRIKDVESTFNLETPGDYEVINTVDLKMDDGRLDSQRLKKFIEKQFQKGTLIVLAVNANELPQALSICRQFESYGLEFVVAPDFGKEIRRGMIQGMRFVGGMPLISGAPGLNRPSSIFIKRILDLVLSLIACILLLPVMLCISFAVVLDRGPVIYAHSRVGKNGKLFKCLKFRTMFTTADKELQAILEEDPNARKEWEKDFKLREDPRVTKIGRFLRRISLDELPQLFNVIRGDMSLVGPRPVIESELVEYYGDEASLYKSVRPGITGLWQISGRNDSGYERRVDIDTRYARTWSVLLDLQIIMRTLPVVVLGKGAY